MGTSGKRRFRHAVRNLPSDKSKGFVSVVCIAGILTEPRPGWFNHRQCKKTPLRTGCRQTFKFNRTVGLFCHWLAD